MANVVEVTDDTFEAEVIKAETPVLVDFWAPWCGPCKALGPVLSEIADERNTELKVVKVNIDDYPELSGEFDIQAIPTMILFDKGDVALRLMGAKGKSAILSDLEPHLHN